MPLIDGGTQRLPRIVGLGRALDLILTGRIVDADEALAMGLLTEVVPAGEHLTRALEMAEGLARFPQETMLADRRAAIEGLGLPLADGLALEAQAGPEVFADAVAGAARFAGGEGRGGAGAGRIGCAVDHALSFEETRLDLLRHRRDGLHRPPPRQELLRNRDGDIYVLVREGSQERLDELIDALGRRRPRQAGRRRPRAAAPRRRRRPGSTSTAARSTTSSTSRRSTT